MSTATSIPRHKTAISRPDVSRPVRLAIDAGVISPNHQVFDYGCGRGVDITRLKKLGIAAEGWDPVYRPDGPMKPADIVNLGYVVNVIEDAAERVKALRTAWELAHKALLVSARLSFEKRGNGYVDFEDGHLSKRQTFQKFFTQEELREWVDTVLEVRSVPAGPGIFFAFKDEDLRQTYLASRVRRQRAAPKVRISDVLYEQHQDLLSPLIDFVTDRGRLPAERELEHIPSIVDTFGSVKRAFSIVRRVTGKEQWERIREERRNELLLQFALDRFGGRARFSELPPDVQLDVKDYFSSYRNACELADVLLFSAGDMEQIDAAAKQSNVGKLTRDAIYIHVDALHHLPPVLRVYEGAAKAWIGEVESANILKLRRDKPKVSYLSYPDFDRDAHPALRQMLVVMLRERDVRYREYNEHANPPILHRKELLLAPEDRRRPKMERLTRQEEQWNLLENPSRIGTRVGWFALLQEKRLDMQGHRLYRAR